MVKDMVGDCTRGWAPGRPLVLFVDYVPVVGGWARRRGGELASCVCLRRQAKRAQAPKAECEAESAVEGLLDLCLRYVGCTIDGARSDCVGVSWRGAEPIVGQWTPPATSCGRHGLLGGGEGGEQHQQS
jgi:hypothetical protein